jgi:hypothetical protein
MKKRKPTPAQQRQYDKQHTFHGKAKYVPYTTALGGATGTVLGLSRRGIPGAVVGGIAGSAVGSAVGGAYAKHKTNQRIKARNKKHEDLNELIDSVSDKHEIADAVDLLIEAPSRLKKWAGVGAGIGSQRSGA